MKKYLFLCLCFSLLALPPADAAFYRWADADGTVHFTDDPDKIPPRYRAKARKLELSEEPAHPAGATGGGGAPHPPVVESEPLTGGHPEEWWRARYGSLREELQSLREAQPAKQKKMLELRHKRTVFSRGSDREAMNGLRDEIAADEQRIAELTDQLQRLDAEAARAGVPADWRR